ncbi:hypothetical protein C1H87_18700 [Flavivirga eckloniae]|uniref:Uncharacterized protein n=1 Tax=Flavivirga eckloniae TaxID=1803846 RepID=A0A2K9PU84_9FLAO|nr:hypothetical protein C1H87_18700 [Flavivirga eckloniae]
MSDSDYILVIAIVVTSLLLNIDALKNRQEKNFFKAITDFLFVPLVISILVISVLLGFND